MDKGYLLHEGKAKRVYTLEDTEEGDDFSKDHLLVEFKDSISAFDGEKTDIIAEKGILNNEISCSLFSYLEAKGINTHYVKKISPREMLVKRVDIIPLEVVVRNVVSGSLIRRLGLVDGTCLKEPVVEFYYKDDELGDPLINEFHIKNLEIAGLDEVQYITEKALEINEILKPYFENLNLTLVDYKLEFGKDSDEKIVLADEISPDSCRLWDKETQKILDKDRYRKDMDEIIESYQEIWNRINAAE